MHSLFRYRRRRKKLKAHFSPVFEAIFGFEVQFGTLISKILQNCHLSCITFPQKPDGTYERLNPSTDKPDSGIDILGNMIEASILSVNRNYYGNLHNRGHNLIAYSHDPENKYLVSYFISTTKFTNLRSRSEAVPILCRKVLA